MLGEYFYTGEQTPVAIVPVTPTDYLDYLLDAPTPPRGVHPACDSRSPCAIGGAYSFTCPPPNVDGWPCSAEQRDFIMKHGRLGRIRARRQNQLHRGPTFRNANQARDDPKFGR